ncbi:hypothetical protein RQP46_000821 [Phenoliferia psychrophenolica]
MAAYNMTEEQMKELKDSYLQGGRSLEELLAVPNPLKDRLKGAEAQRLRSHFASYSLHPVDCDDFERCSALMTGSVPRLRKLWLGDLQAVGGGAAGKALTREKWESYRDSPNKLPVYDILQVGAFTQLMATAAIPDNYFEALDFLIACGISVEGVDIAGHTAFQHSVSCTPLARDLRWSERLLNASKDSIAAVNHRSRYSSTGLHSCIMTYNRPGEDEMRLEVANWLLDRGANADIPDGDGTTARRMAIRLRSQAFSQAISDRDVAREADNGYCSAGCQKLDWAHHKKPSKRHVPSPASTTMLVALPAVPDGANPVSTWTAALDTYVYGSTPTPGLKIRLGVLLALVALYALFARCALSD